MLNYYYFFQNITVVIKQLTYFKHNIPRYKKAHLFCNVSIHAYLLKHKANDFTAKQ